VQGEREKDGHIKLVVGDTKHNLIIIIMLYEKSYELGCKKDLRTEGYPASHLTISHVIIFLHTALE